MMRRENNLSGDLVPIVGIVAAAAVVTGLVLTGLASPPDFARRVAALDGRADQIRRWTSVRPGASQYPQGAICNIGLGKAQDLLRADIGGQAQASGLALSTLEVGADRDAPLGQTLVPIRVRFQVQGAYAAVIGLMDRLSRTRPLLFADAVDLTSNTTSVTMKFSGRAFCSV
jgi:hypothetical protein